MRVKQISNLFQLMDYFVRVGRPVSVRDIVDEFGWPRSSVFNMVSTLVDEGYLYQPVSRGGYYPTSRWMELARAVTDAQPLPESVHLLLVELMKLTGETITLVAADGVNAVVLDVVECNSVVRYHGAVGQRMPLHVTSAGRAILSQYPLAERASVLNRIDYQPRESGAFPSAEAVEADIRRALARGWFVNREDYVSGLAGVAVPFPFRGRRNAVVLGAPVSRIEDRFDEVGQLLQAKVSDFLAEHEIQ